MEINFSLFCELNQEKEEEEEANEIMKNSFHNSNFPAQLFHHSLFFLPSGHQSAAF
jgi:hypothetical protein